MDNYDKFSAQYDAYARTDGRTEIELGHKPMAELLGSRTRGRILDYGCGPGNFTRYLQSRGARVIGVDVSRKQIEAARAYGDGIEYRLIESGNLEGLPDGFDAVTFSFVLLTIPSAEEIVRILASCRRKIAPDGRLAILNADFEASAGRGFISYAIDPIQDPRSGDPIRVWLGRNRGLPVNNFYRTKEDYRRMLETSGFALETALSPRATEGEGWLDEKKYPPTIIMVAKPI